MLLGFLTICAGVVLLQLSQSAKDVPDSAVFSGDLDQVRTVAEQEQPESEPKADAIRGTAALIRNLSVSRQKKEVEEAKRVYEDRKSHLDPIGENGDYEWDGIRRRRTTYGAPSSVGRVSRRKTLHPPLGLTHFPDPDAEQSAGADAHDERDEHGGIIGSTWKRATSIWSPGGRRQGGAPEARSPLHPVALTHISVPSYKGESAEGQAAYGDAADENHHFYGLPPALHKARVDTAGDGGSERARSPGSLTFSPPSAFSPPWQAKRQFSFQNVFSRKQDASTSDTASTSTATVRPVSKRFASRQGSKEHAHGRSKGGTEEERLGLVKGDSSGLAGPADPGSDDESSEDSEGGVQHASLPERLMAPNEEKEVEAYYERLKQRRPQVQPQATVTAPTPTEQVPPVPAKDSHVPDRDGTRARRPSGPRNPPSGGSGAGSAGAANVAFI